MDGDDPCKYTISRKTRDKTANSQANFRRTSSGVMETDHENPRSEQNWDLPNMNEITTMQESETRDFDEEPVYQLVSFFTILYFHRMDLSSIYKFN